MKLLKDKRFYRFLFPSLVGIFLFVTPISQDGNLTIPVAVIANWLVTKMSGFSIWMVWALISISSVVTILHKIFHFSSLKRNTKLDALFGVKGFWFVVRMIGFVLINLIFFGVGPDCLIGGATGGFVTNDLLPLLICVFFLGGMLLSLLVNYGLLDFLGAMLIRVMRPVFKLPGRSALNCVASWLGDGSLGVMMTSKQYEEGFYTKREATVVATTFSAVSITFCLVVISQVGLSHMFLPFYLVVTFAGIVAAVIVPRIPPLSKIPDTYYTESGNREEIPFVI